jgi:DNA-directed RNA polymerase subunit RPC12/RpoP
VDGRVNAVSIVRYRCAACGNLTRFDVTVTRKSRAFHHFTVGGELSVEDEEILSEQVEEVSCRWCGSGRAVEELRGSEV